MSNKTRDHQSWLVEKLTDPTRAAAYLSAAYEDSRAMFREALRDVAQAHQMTKVAREAGVTRESLYRATSEIGNPTFDTLDAVLAAIGVKLDFKPALEDSLGPVLPQTDATISGFRTGQMTLVQKKETRQGIGNTIIVAYTTDIGNSPNSSFQLGQGNKELWLQKMTSQSSLVPRSILEGQMTLPLATQTMCNWNQPSGISS